MPRRPHPPCRHTAVPTTVLRGFTLIELILVMAILSAVLGVAAPSLARFFRGRNLESEATRLVALARQGQSRAVAEGIPMVLWFDEKGRRYGLEADSTWDPQDKYAVSFDLAEDVDMEIRRAQLPRTNGTLEVQVDTSALVRPSIRFQPDGFYAPTSVNWVQLQGRRDASEEPSRLWVALGWNRLYYEVWNTQPPFDRPGS